MTIKHNKNRPSATAVAVSRRLSKAGHTRWDLNLASEPGFVVASYGKEMSVVTHDPGRMPFGTERTRLIEEALDAYQATLEAVGYAVHRQTRDNVFGHSIRVARGAQDPT